MWNLLNSQIEPNFISITQAIKRSITIIIKNKLQIQTRHIPLYLLFILIILYTLNDLQNSTSMGIKDENRQIVYIFLVAIISFLAIFLMKNIKRIEVNFFSALLFMIFFWVTIINILQSNSLWTSLVHISLTLWWLLTYLFFRTYLLEETYSLSKIKNFLYVMVVIYVTASFYAAYNISATYDMIATLTIVYYLIVFVPLILMLSDKKIKNLLLFIILIIIAISMKRGAIITFPAMMLVYLTLDGIIRGRALSNLFKALSLIGGFFISLFFINKITNGYLSSRFSLNSLADGSGRKDLFSAALKDIQDRTFIEFLIGKGSGSSIDELGTGAHNEWLEMLYNFGLIGTIIYALLCLSILFRGIKLMLISSPIAPAYNTMLVYIFTVGLFGGIYFVHSTFYVMAFFGIADSLSQKYQLQKKLEI